LVSCTALETCVTQAHSVHQKLRQKNQPMLCIHEPSLHCGYGEPPIQRHTLKAHTRNNDHMRAVISKEWKPARREDGLLAQDELRISYNDWFQAQYYETDRNTYGYGTHSEKMSECPRTCCVHVSNQTSQYSLGRTTERIMLGTKCIQ